MLALKYRPTTLNEVVGQRPVTQMLKAMIQKNMVPQAMLFSGPRGTGKTSTARIVAETILNQRGSEYSDVLEIDAASNGGVEDVRGLRDSLRFFGNRILILDEAHSLSREAFNALLKVMEEPSEYITFLLVTTEPNKIPETIRSRCISFDFKRLAVKEIYENLVKVVESEGFGGVVSAELLEFIAFKADGGMRDGMMLLDQALRADIRHLDQYEEVLGQLDAGPAVLSGCIEGHSEAISGAREALRYLSPQDIVDSMVETISDVVLLREGMPIQRAGKALEARKKLVSDIGLSQTMKIMKILWSWGTRTRNDNPVRSLEMAVLLISELFNDTSNITSKPQSSGLKTETAPKATISDLANL